MKMNKIVIVIGIVLLLIGALVIVNMNVENSGWVKEPNCATGWRYKNSDYCVIEYKILAEDGTYVPEGYYDE